MPEDQSFNTMKSDKIHTESGHHANIQNAPVVVSSATTTL
jgi:hypothetical protein